MADRNFGFETLCLHAGQVPDIATGARAVPIYQTTSYVFDSTEHAASLFNLATFGNIYSRMMNPTTAVFEERMAALEGGRAAVATASGMAAQMTALLTILEQGDEIVAASTLYGGTFSQLNVTLRKLGINTTFVDPDDPENFRRALTPRTKVLYAETIGNPVGNVVDIEAIAGIAHEAGLPLFIDNTMASPYLCRPIEHGADVVIHSVTKFLGGHGTTLGGVVVESGRFDWGNGKFPQMTEPVPSYNGVSWWGNFGEYGFLTKLRSEQLRDIGPSLSPQAAFQLLQGVETLPFRMDAHLANARVVAEWLAADPRVGYVNWAGLPSHPHHERAQRYLPLGPSSVFAFGIRGTDEVPGREAGRRFIESLQLASHLANIGDARTLVIHPASTTHQQLSAEQLVAAGVPDDLVRISVGLEDVDDILWDLDQALTAAVGPARAATAARATEVPA